MVARVSASKRNGNEVAPSVLQEAASTFEMLAAAVRLHIVSLLAQGERDVGSLAELTGVTAQVVSQHLAKLRLAGLVHARRDGRHQVYLVDDPHVALVVQEMLAHLHGTVPSGTAARDADA